MKNLFNFTYPAYEIKKPIRLIELFGGIGCQAQALKNIGATFEHYKLVENNKSAVQSYNALHHTNFFPIDIQKLDGGGVRNYRYKYL